MQLRKLTAPRSVSMTVFAKAVSLLVRKTHACVDDIVEETGLHPTTAARLMHALHKEKLTHIGGWLEDTMGREQTPVYHFGVGADTPRKKLTGAERSRRYRDNIRAEQIHQRIKNQGPENA